MMDIISLLNHNVDVATRDAARPPFLSFAPEIRNMIYRFIFFQDFAIIWGSQVRLHTQVLRTCRQIYDEALPILYSENTWRIEMCNAPGPHYDSFRYPGALKCDFSKDVPDWRLTVSWPTKTISALPHLRRFSILVTYTDGHKVAPIREDTRWLAECLAKVSRIDFLHLECKLDWSTCGVYDWRDPDANNFPLCDDGTRDVIRVLQTWLGRLRNVGEVVVEGLPEANANTIEERWKSSEPLEKTPLTKMYECLEPHVRDIGSCKALLHGALLAVEKDDMEDFKGLRTELVEHMKQRLEAIEGGVMRYDPKEAEDEEME
ncbi:hypothetical protein B0T26DRAFT_669513 [Lasiosphaeria miniovina]|uniref:Uncharacterized protein n=1 Tax=Lasiosphaeria miniovina TaxID=1954250 RepID=A0AA40BF50_9PEZI|nr:uncharacterized protein B0T26DRAFT_669513 [Lasiosphaeria miniovina]KAK0733060.1 hypothetical protein B0T26DRAFT_669513 [Lasiosphaeria miniovina]